MPARRITSLHTAVAPFISAASGAGLNHGSDDVTMRPGPDDVTMRPGSGDVTMRPKPDDVTPDDITSGQGNAI